MMLYVYALKIIRRVMAERSSAEENRLKKLKSKAKPIRNMARYEMQEAMKYGCREDRLVGVVGCQLPLSELKVVCAHLDLLLLAQSWRGAEIELNQLPQCWQKKIKNI